MNMEKSDHSRLNESPNDFDHDDQQTVTIPESMETGFQPDDLDRTDTNADFSLVDKHQSSSDSDGSRDENIPMNTNGLYQLEEQSSRDESIDSTEASIGEYPTGFEEMYGEGQWCAHNTKPGCFIRNEKRNGHTEDATECATDPDELFLEQQFQCKTESEKLYFHATSWKCARKIMKKYPKIGQRSGDIAPMGAFYVNPDYQNCYKWLNTRNSVFRGRHAILIFKFDPWLLEPKGEDLTVHVWQNVSHNRHSKKCKFRWSIAPQNSDPANAQNQGKNPTPNKTSNNKVIAWQMVIRCPRMCRKLSDHLVGCIFYRNTDSGRRASNAQRSEHRNEHVKNKKRGSSQITSKSRDSKKSRRK